MDQALVSAVVDEVVRSVKGETLIGRGASKIVAVGISNRHGHLTAEHSEILFGPGKRLTPLRDLLQPNQFASKETISVATNKGIIHNVRLIGPERKYTQVELSRTDAFALGLNPPLRQSGELDASPGCVLMGPHGSVIINRGVIMAGRHLHCHTSQARELGLHDRQLIRARIPGPRGGIMDSLLVRVGDGHTLECHLDTDEGNAFGLASGDKIELLI